MAGRDMAAEVRARLDAAGVGYEVLPCEPELADTAQFCAHYGHDPADSANTILVAGRVPVGERPPVAACVVLATSRLDVNNVVRKRLGVRKASFASADLTSELTGMLIGGVTPIALPPGVPVWVDEAVLGRDRVIIGSGDRSSKIRLAPEALITLGGEAVTALGKPA
jgi:prolyl-tRNA editing enzyme YbaK/EbsC (Cys-tRNA(Pro) deacylase)